jgi:hypothetical protein
VETLGRGVDFVRADFYDTAGQFYFGGLTTTSIAGGSVLPEGIDAYLGGFWRCPNDLRLADPVEACSVDYFQYQIAQMIDAHPS